MSKKVEEGLKGCGWSPGKREGNFFSWEQLQQRGSNSQERQLQEVQKVSASWRWGFVKGGNCWRLCRSSDSNYGAEIDVKSYGAGQNRWFLRRNWDTWHWETWCSKANAAFVNLAEVWNRLLLPLNRELGGLSVCEALKQLLFWAARWKALKYRGNRVIWSLAERRNWLETWRALLLGAECTSGFVPLNWDGVVQVIITLEKLLSQKQWDRQGS